MTTFDRQKFSTILKRLLREKKIRLAVSGSLEIGSKEYICILKEQWESYQELWEKAFELYLCEAS